MLKKLFAPIAVVAAAMFAYAPFMILNAPYESTMGLIQKIFYFHVGSAMAMFVSAFVSGIGSAVFVDGTVRLGLAGALWVAAACLFVLARRLRDGVEWR